MKDFFIVHPSVFHDAFRTDYTTPYKDSSKQFLNLLRDHFIHKGTKIAYTSGEVFKKLYDSVLGKGKAIWIIPEYLVNIDFETYLDESVSLKIDQSIIKLASKMCITNSPFIVSTKANIDKENTTFMIETPAKAIERYKHPNSNF